MADRTQPRSGAVVAVGAGGLERDGGPARSARPSERRWAVLATIIAFEFVIELDASIVNIALPSIGRELHASTSQLQWVVDAYVLVLASLLLFAGTIVDRVGGRRMLAIGACTFCAASVLAALASSTGLLIAMRAVMGLGGAMLLPATLFVLSDTFPPAERARAFAIWSAVAGLSFALGPTLGGWLVQEFGWGAIFWINVPILAGALLAGLPLIRSARAERPRPADAAGACLAIVALTCLLYAVIEAPSRGWTADRTFGAFALSALAFGGLALRESRAAFPMLDARLLGGRRTAAAAAVLGFTFLAMAGALFVLTQYLQLVLSYSPLGAGLRIVPVAIVFALTATGSVGLSARFGSRVAVTVGLALLAASLAAMSTVSDSSGYGLVLGTLLAAGVGLGLATAPAMGVTLDALPSESAGVGSSVNTTAINFGSALGVAVVGSVLASRFANLLPAGASGSGSARESVSTAFQTALQSRDAALARALHHDFIAAARPAFLVCAGIAAAGAALAGTLLPGASAPDGAQGGIGASAGAREH